MFYPFKPSHDSQPHVRQLTRLQAKITKIQRAWAERLNKRAQRIDPRKLKAILIAAGLAAASVAAGLIYRGIIPQKLTIHRFELPMPTLPGSISVPESPGKQQAMDLYLDSLEKAFIFDSIQNNKPKTNHDSPAIH